jgi:hypothetical protein
MTKKYCVYVVYCGWITRYVGSGTKSRPAESLKERKGLFYRIVYETNNRTLAYQMEKWYYRFYLLQGFHLLNAHEPRVVHKRPSSSISKMLRCLFHRIIS